MTRMTTTSTPTLTPNGVRRLTLALALSAAALPLAASPNDKAPAANPLSVHVLNLQTGEPSPGIEVDLERQTEAGWEALSTARTDVQGRVKALWPAARRYESGVYRVVFKTGAYYTRQQQPSFFPEVPVIFRVDAAQAHYHIPLLLSPFGYSTYRGN